MWKQSKQGEIPRAEDKKKPVQPVKTNNFDAETGQDYNDAQARIGSRYHSDWIGAFNTPSLIRHSQPNSHGARTLLDMAKTSTVKQLRSLNQEHLALVPWSVARDIWAEVVASRRESFYTWRIFAASYPSEGEFGSPSYRHHLHIRTPSLALEDYFRGITSDEMRWLACLRISPKETRATDLISLSRISNLAILDLSDGQAAIDTKVSSLDERVFRTWAELAKTEGRFKNLQAILLGWQEHISMWLFKYLSSFPSLRQVIITDCAKIHQKNRKDWEPIALEHGWEARHGKRSAKSLRPILNEPGFHLGAVSGLLWSSSGIRKDEKVGRVSRPVLEFWLGTPRTWTHILDDFPGTRTVFFDRSQQSIKEDRTVQSSIEPDLVKRARNMEQRSIEMSSPPPKRKLKSGLKMRADFTGAADLLAEFTKE